MNTRRSPDARRAGSILVMSLLVTIALAFASLVFFTVSKGSVDEWNRTRRRLALIHAADAGLGEALALMTLEEDAVVGSPDLPATFGGIDYFVEAEDLGDGLFSLVSTSTDGTRTVRVQLLCEEGARANPFIGIYGREDVTIAGNAILDSYDSLLGSYAAQVSGDHANSSLMLMSSGSIDLGSGAMVYGDAYWSGDPSDHAWISGSSHVEGTFDVTVDPPELPAIEAPTIKSSGTSNVVKGVPQKLTGDLHYDKIYVERGAVLNIVGPATLVVDDFNLTSGGTLNFDTSSGPIEIYATDQFILASNSNVTTTSTDSSLIRINVMAVHDAQFDSSPLVKFASNGQFSGIVYGPEAYISFASNFEFFGSVAARWFELSSNALFHYDENLKNAGAGVSSAPTITAWRVTNELELEKEGFRFTPVD